MPYSTVADLLTGNIPTPAYMSPEKYVADAADEIDSVIGFVYKTPVEMADVDATRPARLLLKRINNFLASGRILMAAASAQEDNQVHAYAARLIREATDSLKLIASGQILLEGAEALPQSDSPKMAPLIANVDPESNVEAFYDRVANPSYLSYNNGEVERGLVR